MSEGAGRCVGREREETGEATAVPPTTYSLPSISPAPSLQRAKVTAWWFNDPQRREKGRGITGTRRSFGCVLRGLGREVAKSRIIKPVGAQAHVFDHALLGVVVGIARGSFVTSLVV